MPNGGAQFGGKGCSHRATKPAGRLFAVDLLNDFAAYLFVDHCLASYLMSMACLRCWRNPWYPSRSNGTDHQHRTQYQSDGESPECKQRTFMNPHLSLLPRRFYFHNNRSLLALWSLHNLECDAISFIQGLVSFRNYRAEMDEHIGFIPTPDKSVALALVEPQHNAFHAHVPCLGITFRGRKGCVIIPFASRGMSSQ